MDVDIKMEVDEKSVPNLVTTDLISHDSMVTCGKCKEEMSFHDYESKHRSSHYNLCWLDGVEEEIDFTNTSNIQGILRKFTYKWKTKLEFKCEWCDEVKRSIVGFSNHLQKCKNNSLLNKNDESVEQSLISFNDSTTIQYNNSEVSCARCGETMKYEEYKQSHRHKHYNLCWLEGEEKLDYLDENNLISLLREILPKYAERNKKVSYTCEWCGEHKKSVIGYATHVKKCAIEQKSVLSVTDGNTTSQILSEELEAKYDSTVICGRCNKSMLFKEYDKEHRFNHYNLCWVNGEEKPNLDDESVTQSLLRQCLPKNAARQKKVHFTCEWCQTQKKSVPGFASHVKQCRMRPDKLGLLSNDTECENDSILKTDIEITKERDESMVTCGRCSTEMTFKEYRCTHCAKHYNLCWIEGEDKPNFEDYKTVLAILRQCIPFRAARNRTLKLTCEYCKSVKKSIVGFASHVIYCNKSSKDIKLLLVTCEDCGRKVKPASLTSHKLHNCKGFRFNAECDVSFCDENDIREGGFYKSRRKRRPPNVLSFHADTKYVTEYYDCICRLCEFNTMSVHEIIKHITTVHNINKNDIHNNVSEYISNKFEFHRNIYLRPLLNFYNFFKKTFWKTICHEGFQPKIRQLNDDEALKYLPTIQQSCKIINSDEELCVQLFNSTYINDMYWLFTGGPNWAMSWCPVPEEVQTQYLAISCHPKPDLEHKEMDIYKYPSLVQLWTFESLHNLNIESVSSMPYMSYGLAHEFGAVWEMAWCPSGAYEPMKKIGLLALSTSSGDCPIYAMPHVIGNPEKLNIYAANCVIARNFECDWIEVGVQCKKVCWQAVSPFKTLVCGYSNGMVSVFILNFKSIFFSHDILYPSHTFRASRCSITGLSINYLNPSILATTATDGKVILWDLNSTENPIFQKKSYCPSDCTWLHQCYTLVHSSKGVNPLFLKVRTINFSNCDDDVSGYNPELYVLTNVTNSSKIVSGCNVVKNDESFNCDDMDITINESIPNVDNEVSNKTNSNKNSDDDSSKSFEPNTSSDDEEKSYNPKKTSADASKTNEEEDFYGPTFFQKGTHWCVSGSDWMNIIASGDENGVVYEKLFLPENNQLNKSNATMLQLLVKKLTTNETPQTEFSNGYRFKETAKEFALESRFYTADENLKNNKDDNKPLLRYPLDNINKVCWNQNFSSFRWLAIGTQSGFVLVSPSRTITDSCIDSFYKLILNPDCTNDNNKNDDQTDV